MALTPGLPKIPFIVMAFVMFYVVSRISKNSREVKPKPDTDPGPKHGLRPEEESLDNFVNTDRISVEIGASLIPFVEQRDHQGLKDRISQLRLDLTKKYGLWVPKVRIRDTLSLGKATYRFSINGRKVAESEVFVDEYLAINSGNSQLKLEGRSTLDPAFGLQAMWISQSQKRRAEFGGYTVVDALTVITTHLGEVLRQYAHELLGREDLQKMLDKVKETAPTIVDEIKPDIVRTAVLRKVLVHLLEERVPINNLVNILESVVQHGAVIKDPDLLADHVRIDIGATLCEPFRGKSGNVRVMILDPRLETRLLGLIHDGRLALQPGPLEKLVTVLRGHWEKNALLEENIALLVDGNLRRPLRNAIRRSLNELSVLSYLEIPTNLMIDPGALLSNEDIFGTEANAAPPQAFATGPKSAGPQSAGSGERSAGRTPDLSEVA